MDSEFDYSSFIDYLKERLQESSNDEVNGLETLVDYYIDYPPEGLDGTDSDFFREEIDRVVQNEIFEIQKKLLTKESSWLTVEDDKWKLNTATVEKVDHAKTILYGKLTVDEEKLLDVSVLDIDDSKRESLISLYNQKVSRYGTTQEKYKTITLIADSFNHKVDGDNGYVKHLSTAGKVGRKLKEQGSYAYYERVAKSYRNKYEHEASAKYFQLAIETAKDCGEDNSVELSLIKAQRIQYELCSDEECAAQAFIHENNLKAKTESRKSVKVMLCLLRILSDYCQNPRKVALWAAALILFSAIVYSFAGITPSEQQEQTLFSQGVACSRVLLDAIYFSIVTFTTLGYGDFAPSNGISRLMANFEALGGLFFTSLFLVTLVRKYGR